MILQGFCSNTNINATQPCIDIDTIISINIYIYIIEHPPSPLGRGLSKRSGENIGCQDKNSSWVQSDYILNGIVVA